MNGRRWVNPHHRRTAARAGASGAPGLRVSGQRAPTGKCLFSLLNLSNTNTVNFISEGRLPWIIYEPPVSIPKPPLCLPACVFAHTSSRVLVNQHIVKCLCMQRGGGGGGYTHLSLSTVLTLKSFLSILAGLLWQLLLSWELLIFLCPPSPYIPAHWYTNSLLNAPQCETPQCDFSYVCGGKTLPMPMVWKPRWESYKLCFSAVWRMHMRSSRSDMLVSASDLTTVAISCTRITLLAFLTDSNLVVGV